MHTQSPGLLKPFRGLHFLKLVCLIVFTGARFGALRGSWVHFLLPPHHYPAPGGGHAPAFAKHAQCAAIARPEKARQDFPQQTAGALTVMEAILAGFASIIAMGMTHE